VGQAKVDRNVALGHSPVPRTTTLIRRALLASPYQLHISAESSLQSEVKDFLTIVSPQRLATTSGGNVPPFSKRREGGYVTSQRPDLSEL
jgi:hypothetical protein